MSETLVSPESPRERVAPGPTKKSSARRLAALLVTVICVTVLTSHVLGYWLGFIGEAYWPIHYGSANGEKPWQLTGSSIVNYGIDWFEISREVNRPIRAFSTASGSPSEMEFLQPLLPESDRCFIAISVYEMNEHALADTRPRIVPLSRTIADIARSKSDWLFTKKLVGQYALSALNRLLPTAGKSTAVMVGLRAKLRTLKGALGGDGTQQELAAQPTHLNVPTASIREWSPGRSLRNITQMRVACQGKHAFSGPKHLALSRMLNPAHSPPKTVIVMPVSPKYEAAFVTEVVRKEFEAALRSLQRSNPTVSWIRLDHLPALQSDDYFWDLVHLNQSGRAIATKAFLQELQTKQRGS